MRDDTPSVYLLAGPAGPAKEAYVRALTDRGVVEVRPVSDVETASSLVAQVQTGRDAFLDHDLVEAEERDRYKALVEEHGGEWCLINFGDNHRLLASRLGDSASSA